MTRLPFILADLEAAFYELAPEAWHHPIEILVEPDAFTAIKRELIDHYSGTPGRTYLIEANFIRIGRIEIKRRG